MKAIKIQILCLIICCFFCSSCEDKLSSFKETDARVTKVRIRNKASNRSTIYSLYLTYQYQVGEKIYQGAYQKKTWIE